MAIGVWSYDRAVERTSDGRPLRILAIIDEYTRKCLPLHVARRIRSGDLLDQLYELFLTRGIPEYIRSDHGPEFAAKAVRSWLSRLKVTKLFIEPGSPWENGSVESFIGKMRDELLNGEVLDTLEEAKVLVEAWRKACNRIRPRSSLGNVTPEEYATSIGAANGEKTEPEEANVNDSQNIFLTKKMDLIWGAPCL